MRGWNAKSGAPFSYVSCEARVPMIPVRPIRRIDPIKCHMSTHTPRPRTLTTTEPPSLGPLENKIEQHSSCRAHIRQLIRESAMMALHLLGSH